MAARGVVLAKDQYKELQDKLEELTMCPICKERFKQPKILNCHHTFCLQCLQSYFMLTPEESSPCPLCRCLFFPPKGDVSNLPTSTFMQDVVMMIERKSPITKKHCMVCKTTNNDAGYMCVECDVQMCESCRDIHETFRMDSHNLLRLDEIQDVPIISVIAGKKTSRKCDEHSGHILEHLCLSCNIPMCSECKNTSHSQHRSQNIFHAAEETRNIIRLIQKSSNPDAKRLTEAITEIKSLSTSMQISTDAMKDEVRTMADLLVNMVREKERKMLHHIEKDAVLRQKELKSIEDATEFRLTSLFTFLDYVKSLETFGDVTQLSVAKQTIQKRLEENEKQTLPTLPESCRCNWTFKRSEIFESILHSEDLGSIESFLPNVQRKPPPPIPPRIAPTQIHSKSPVSISPTPDHPPVTPQREPRPSDETFVKQLTSDNEYTNPQERIWQEENIHNPLPVVSSKEHNEIVTQRSGLPPPPPKPHTRVNRLSMSRAESEYLKVSAESPMQRMRRALSDSQLIEETDVKSILSSPAIKGDGVSFNANVKISGLAITKKDDIIVVSNYNKICLVFDKLGNLKNQISDKMVSPWDAAVSMTEDDLKEVVYLTDTGERSGDGEVKVYRLDGTYVRTLVSQLRKPHGITASTDSDVIYVCDAEDSSIIVLSARRRGQKARKIKQNMLGKNMFTCPWYISLTDGEIVVSDFDAGKLIGINKDTQRKRRSYKPETSRNASGFRPAMSCVDSESNIYVVDQISSCIYVWTACQTPVKMAMPSSIDIKRPVALAFDSSGALWIGSRSGMLVRTHIYNL